MAMRLVARVHRRICVGVGVGVDRYVHAVGRMNVTADWTGIVRYQWAIGTAGAATQYSKTFVDAQMATTLRYECQPTDNSDFAVTVQGLADPDIGLKGVEVQPLDVATNSPLRDWFSIGIPVLTL
ncbi:hypothetical protein HDU90_008845 [Geranomyces variabilis]|nr:hypothetical protein HDU90_008845 [Geranomyces variabilis]